VVINCRITMYLHNVVAKDAIILSLSVDDVNVIQ